MSRLIKSKQKDRGKDGKVINHMEISTKEKCRFGLNLLLLWWKEPDKTNWTQQQIIDEYKRVTNKMDEFKMDYDKNNPIAQYINNQ